MIAIQRSISFLAIALLMVFSSCKKDEEAAPAPVAPTVFAFSFNANGTNYTCTEANVETSLITSPLGGNILSMTATTATGETISILCNPAVGSYGLGGFTSSAMTYIKGPSFSQFTEGTINVTFNNTTNKRISGTFNAKGISTTITNGVFSFIKY